MKKIRYKIKNWILNHILTETEKVLIVESLDDRLCSTQTMLSESREDLSKDIIKLKRKFKTITPGCTWYNIEK